MVQKLLIFLLFVILYFVIPKLFTLIGNEIKRSLSRRNRQNKNVEEISPQQKAKLARQFGLQESSKKSTLKILYIASILLAPILSMFNIIIAIPIVILMPYIYKAINNSMISKEYQDRQEFLERFLTFKRSAMGLIDNKSTIYDYSKEFQILEWEDVEDENNSITVKRPTKVRLFIPVTFDPIRQDKFLEDMSIQFGRGRPFEVDITDKEYPGWDQSKGIATVSLQAALPSKAMWDEYYIKHPDVQWSFFPLGISSKGGLPMKHPETGEDIHVIGFDVDGTQKKYCQKNGIPVGPDIEAAVHSIFSGPTGSGKSVAQWNVMNRCLADPEDWLLFGVDMKKVELSQLRKYGVVVGTTMEDARDVIVFVQKVMMDRYARMEELGINNWKDIPKDEQGPAIMLLVDEAGELLAKISGKSEESQAQQECQDQIRSALESIARLGRAARVFQILAAQRPDAETISMQIRQNSPIRVGFGTLPVTISQMLFEDTSGARTPGSPKGRARIKVHGITPIEFQGFFETPDWIDRYLEKHNLPQLIYGSDSSKERDNFNQMKQQNEEENKLEEGLNKEEFNELSSILKDI